MKSMPLKFPEKLQPYKGVIYFVIVLFVSNFLWKWTISGDESDALVTFFGIDISQPFNWMAAHIAIVSEKWLQFFGLNIQLEPYNILRNENGHAVRVVWACTGIKQAFIYLCILIFARGTWKRKLWYIPLGLGLVHFFNIFRIAAITALMLVNPNWFEFLHEQLFKYLFYGLIFLIWVIWEEKIAGNTVQQEESNN